MTSVQASNKIRQLQAAPAEGERLELDESALDAAKRSLDDGAVTPSYGPWRAQIVELLNGALATELVCVLRYKRHYFTAHGMSAPQVAAEFLEHANAEAAHADISRPTR
jgi:bacterioferritin